MVAISDQPPKFNPVWQQTQYRLLPPIVAFDLQCAALLPRSTGGVHLTLDSFVSVQGGKNDPASSPSQPSDTITMAHLCLPWVNDRF